MFSESAVDKLYFIIPPTAASASFRQAYMSPEQVEGEGLMLYSPKVDTWGLGVIAFEMLHDTMPFRLRWLNSLMSR